MACRMSSFDGKPAVAVGTEDRLRTDGREEGESEGGEFEKGVSIVGREEVDGRGERTRREKKASGVEGKVEGGGWKRVERGGCKATEEEEKKAVAVIAGVLREKFGPQIVRGEEEEEEGFRDGRIMDEKEAKGREEEEEVGYGDEETEGAEVEGEEDEEWEEGEDAAAEAGAEASEGDAPPTTSPPTRPPPRNSPRVVSPSSLLSLYRFFSSHLGISSPSTVASLLASHPALLRSDPASDLLPRVHLLQSYGISHANISAITLQYLEKLLGRKATGSVVRSYTSILILSVENMQGKVALLGDLIGRENAVLAVARNPSILGANEENLKRGFSELVREVEEALEESGGEENGRQMLQKGARKLVREVEEALEGGEDGGVAPESPPVEEPQKDAMDARKCAEGGGSGAEARTGEGRGFKNASGCLPAREMVANLRIRPRHLALLRKGYVLVPHEVALPKNGEGGVFGRSGAEEKAAGEDVGGKDEFGGRIELL
ncbi:unnamed protein product [Closterium sp. Naga37s-1]|nr:unnamed protein product [Closterium sp. Naga37s-1]